LKDTIIKNPITFNSKIIHTKTKVHTKNLNPELNKILNILINLIFFDLEVIVVYWSNKLKYFSNFLLNAINIIAIIVYITQFMIEGTALLTK